jgi:alkanesulfonate monooxygenase SsuD/methylene tetrahydromethanopterin reductase-like flavin-dependent oxidoreductase (luciferase family)
MRVCLMIEGQEGVTWEHWVALADAAEEAGLDALFRSDHYLSIVRGGDAGSLDAWTTLAGLAARTSRLRLGTLVSPVTFRHASLLAKSVVTVDHISGGRAELGIGAGWYEAEHEAYGFAFPPVRERMDELDRQLEAVHRQWTQDESVWPKPVQQPQPTLIVGGAAKPRTVAAAVRFADEYNTVFASPEVARERRETVQRAAETAGRRPLRFSLMTGAVVGREESDLRARTARYLEITREGRSVDEFLRDKPPHMVVGLLEEAAAQLRVFAAAGLDRIMLQHLAHEDAEMVPLLGELQRALG